MSQAINLKDAGSELRNLVQSIRSANEECEVKDDVGQTVAVVLPAERYESYQAYQRRRDANFAVLDRFAEKTKGYDPDFIEAQIEKAVEEVKAKSRAKRPSA